MKKLIYFFGVLVLVLSFSTCDELDELTEIDVDTSVTERITVNIDSGENVPINSTVKVNIDNPDTHEYLNKIEKVKINSLTYKAVNFSGPGTDGVITVDLMADSVILATHTGIRPFDEIGVEYLITDEATLTSIANKLKNGLDVVMAAVGTSSSESAFSFQIEITLDLEVTVDAG